MRVATKRILAVNYELIKHLRPSPPKWGSVFYGRQNTRALSGTTTRQEALGTPPQFRRPPVRPSVKSTDSRK